MIGVIDLIGVFGPQNIALSVFLSPKQGHKRVKEL